MKNIALTTQQRGMAWFFASLCLGIATDAGIKLLLQTTTSGAWQLTTLSLGIQVLFLLPYLLWNGKTAVATTHLKLHIGRGAILFSALFLWSWGLHLAPLTTTANVTLTMPFCSLWCARLLLKERIPKPLWWLSIAGMGAILPLFYCGSWPEWRALSALLASNVCFALLDGLHKKLLNKESTLAMLWYANLVACILATPFALYSWHPLSYYNTKVLTMVAVGQLLTFYALLRALACVKLRTFAHWRYWDFIIALATGWLVFHDWPANEEFLALLLLIPTLTLFYSLKKQYP